MLEDIIIAAVWACFKSTSAALLQKEKDSNWWLGLFTGSIFSFFVFWSALYLFNLPFEYLALHYGEEFLISKNLRKVIPISVDIISGIILNQSSNSTGLDRYPSIKECARGFILFTCLTCITISLALYFWISSGVGNIFNKM
ncbi:hypothetical protein KJ596_02955 [Patescibacteria group bacterium]|nr:hypothetical protein [Patescibacteria group bacterium]MBU1868272.1 hypothetical protein [Patescibacteria group bacterium]